MPFTRTFEWGEDQNGNIGWIMKGMPHFDAGLQPFTIAHDVLEHLDRGTEFTDELQAFGSMLYIRTLSGWFYEQRSMHTAADNMASDLVLFCEQNQWHVPVIKTRRLDDIDDDAEYELSAVVDAFVHHAKAEAAYYGEEDQYAAGIDLVQHGWDIVAWMRRGFRRAYRRYHKASPTSMGILFSDLCSTLDTREFRRPDYEEANLIVRVDPVDLTCKVRYDYPYDY